MLIFCVALHISLPISVTQVQQALARCDWPSELIAHQQHVDSVAAGLSPPSQQQPQQASNAPNIHRDASHGSLASGGSGSGHSIHLSGASPSPELLQAGGGGGAGRTNSSAARSLGSFMSAAVGGLRSLRSRTTSAAGGAAAGGVCDASCPAVSCSGSVGAPAEDGCGDAADGCGGGVSATGSAPSTLAAGTAASGGPVGGSSSSKFWQRGILLPLQGPGASWRWPHQLIRHSRG